MPCVLWRRPQCVSVRVCVIYECTREQREASLVHMAVVATR